MKETKIDDKIFRCKKLGAEKFQKVVFGAEKIKYFVIKKIFPNYLKFMFKNLDKEKNRLLSKAKTQEEKTIINNKYKKIKMTIKKEYNTNNNINYHINAERPLDILPYLNWNKNIHKNGLKTNILMFPFITLTFMISPILFTMLTIYDLISIFINFQCINIQEYNICRIEKHRKTLEKYQERKKQKIEEKYTPAINVIGKTIQASEDIPTIEDIIGNIKTKEELENLKIYLMRFKEQKNISPENLSINIERRIK